MTDYLATLTHTGLTMRVPALPAQPVAAGTVQTMTLVRDQVIPVPVLIEAHAHVDALAAELGIPVPYVVWFAPKAEAPRDVGHPPSCDCGDWTRTAKADCSVLGGLAIPEPGLPQTIFILHSLRGDVLRMVIAHELRHLAQSADMGRDEREADAERYGMAHVG